MATDGGIKISTDFTYLLEDDREDIETTIEAYTKAQNRYREIEAKIERYSFGDWEDLFEKYSAEEADTYMTLMDEHHDIEMELSLLREELEDCRSAANILGIDIPA